LISQNSPSSAGSPPSIIIAAWIADSRRAGGVLDIRSPVTEECWP
jgi:hypothetical protein